MTQEEREQFRVKLTAMQRAIRAISDSAAQDLKPIALDQTSVGQVSYVDAIKLQQMLQETALRRIESGRFGLCFPCEPEIDLRRLGAGPR